MKLKCIANAFYKGELVKAGSVDTYEKEDAKELLASGRFELATEEEKSSKAAKAEK